MFLSRIPIRNRFYLVDHFLRTSFITEVISHLFVMKNCTSGLFDVSEQLLSTTSGQLWASAEKTQSNKFTYRLKKIQMK